METTTDSAASTTVKKSNPYLPIYITTGVFALIVIVSFIIFRKPKKAIVRWCIGLACFNMWLLWLTVYIAQLNLIVGPRLHCTTLFWIAEHWDQPDGFEFRPSTTTPIPTTTSKLPFIHHEKMAIMDAVNGDEIMKLVESVPVKHVWDSNPGADHFRLRAEKNNDYGIVGTPIDSANTIGDMPDIE